MSVQCHIPSLTGQTPSNTPQLNIASYRRPSVGTRRKTMRPAIFPPRHVSGSGSELWRVQGAQSPSLRRTPNLAVCIGMISVGKIGPEKGKDATAFCRFGFLLQHSMPTRAPQRPGGRTATPMTELRHRRRVRTRFPRVCYVPTYPPSSQHSLSRCDCIKP